MTMEIVEAPLLHGDTVRVTRYQITYMDRAGRVEREINVLDLGDVKRQRNALTLFWRDGRSFQLTFEHHPDAHRAEEQIAVGIRHAGRQYR